MRKHVRTFALQRRADSQTDGQKEYMDALRGDCPIVVVTGPAGTGKTLLACQEAALRVSRDNHKLVLTRPLVSVGEDVGFLPGNVEQKLHPWLLPIYDSLKIFMSKNELKDLKKQGELEVAPFAYLRGRTFKNSVIIADEMQNSTVEQMKTLLTRLGENSKMIVTGDTEQSDKIGKNGLQDLLDMDLAECKYIKHIELGTNDVMRHYAVKEVLTLYAKK